MEPHPEPNPPSRPHLPPRVGRGIKIPDILERSFPVRNFRQFGSTSRGSRGDRRFPEIAENAF